MSPDDGSVFEDGYKRDRYWDGEPVRESGPDAAAEEARSEARPPESTADKTAVIEALLFVSPEPLSVGMVSEITGFDPGAVREILNSLVELYLERSGGLVIREVAGGFGLYAVQEAAPFIARMIRSQANPRLTRAALETLAIVAYLQPVSRGFVAEIRGVQSEGVMKTLDERGLVTAVGKGGPPGYPVLYGTTGRFLERFGLKDLDELPDLEEFAPDDATLERIKRSLSWELVEEGAGGRHPEAGENTEDSGGRWDSVEEGGGEPDPGGPGRS